MEKFDVETWMIDHCFEEPSPLCCVCREPVLPQHGGPSYGGNVVAHYGPELPIGGYVWCCRSVCAHKLDQYAHKYLDTHFLMWMTEEFDGKHHPYFGSTKRFIRQMRLELKPLWLDHVVAWIVSPARRAPGARVFSPPVLPSKLPKDQNIFPVSLSLRFDIFKRDNYRCRLCGIAAKDGDHVRLEIDHITPRSKGGTNDPSNIWVLCFACNRGKRDTEL